MRTLRSLVTSFVAPRVTPRVIPLAAVVLAAARPAAAQPAAAAVPASVARAVPGTENAAALPTAPRRLATYRFARTRGTAMPTELTLADSAGVLLASFRLPGDRDARPMAVDLTPFDLVLQGETPAGVLTLRFFRPAEAAEPGLVSGRWWLGAEEGTLRGRERR